MQGNPEDVATVRCVDAGRSFLGLEVRLALVPADRVKTLVREAWIAQAPEDLVNRPIAER